MSSRVLLIGASGMLGRAMAAELRKRDWSYDAPPRSELNLGDPDQVRRLVKFRSPPPLVINCAAWTDVDGAERDEAAATRINGEAVAELTRLANMDSTLVTFSTDYVFAGDAQHPYPTSAGRAPLNAYGRSKAVGEAAMEERPMGWLNIRTSWLYAPWGKNFVRTMRKLLMEKSEVRVVNDQQGRPTSAEHLARSTLALLDRGAEGHHHVTDGGACTWFEFAAEIGRLAGAPGRVEPCSSSEFPRPAKRPAYSVLDISETERLIGPMPDWRANLADVIARLEP
jgi:dTDP-4-dehydrorhamnose reductase